MKTKLAGMGGAPAQTFVDDVFSTYLYTGNGATQTITNGIDLAGKGGLVWIKSRSAATNNFLFDTARGVNVEINSNTGDANATLANSVTAFSSNGFAVGSAAGINVSAATYASWTFRKAAKFFDVQTVTHTNGTANNIDLSVLGTVGMVIAKITSTTGDWTVWHRGLTAGNNLQLNLTNAQSTTNAWLSVSGTTATLAAAAPTGTYVIYAYAHDTSSTGIIQCGSFTTDASGGFDVNLGWEPQFILIKSSGGTGSNWYMLDAMRGMSVTGTNGTDKRLYANTSAAEAGDGVCWPTSTGFKGVSSFVPSTTHIYMAIRRPNKPPTSGTQVYNPLTYTGGSTFPKSVLTGNLTDLVFNKARNDSAGPEYWLDRLRGTAAGNLRSNATSAEDTSAGVSFDVMNGYNIQSALDFNNAYNYVTYTFKRAPGFFDEVCYTGTGSATTQAHNLGVVPELIIVKSRNNAADWWVYSSTLGTGIWLRLNSTLAAQTYANMWTPVPTNSSFGLQTDPTNFSTYTYVAYLFATLAGIQYINSYVGDGTTGRVINCGFSAGARFICIKATSTTGSWWVWDSARGITSTNDPVLQLNSTAAEITSADAIDPSSSGFIVNQEATCSINASGVSYLVWAIA